MTKDDIERAADLAADKWDEEGEKQSVDWYGDTYSFKCGFTQGHALAISQINRPESGPITEANQVSIHSKVNSDTEREKRKTKQALDNMDAAHIKLAAALEEIKRLWEKVTILETRAVSAEIELEDAIKERSKTSSYFDAIAEENKRLKESFNQASSQLEVYMKALGGA